MDLSSRLEERPSFDQLEEDSKLNEEAHDLPTLPKAKKKINNCGVGVNFCTGCVFLITLCSTIISLTIVVIINSEVLHKFNDTSNTTTGCVLSGKFSDDYNPPFHFGTTINCNFVVFGTAALGGLSLLYLSGSCCRAVYSIMCGLSAFNIVNVIDFVIMTMSTLFAMALGIMINLGRHETCTAVQRTHAVDSSCTTSFIMDGDHQYDFDKWLNVAEISAWTTTTVFAFMAVINMFLSLIFIFKWCYKMKKRGNNDNEMDAFNRNFENDDDDDSLLDPSKTGPPQLQFEGENVNHTSFPPYNTGSDNSPW